MQKDRPKAAEAAALRSSHRGTTGLAFSLALPSSQLGPEAKPALRPRSACAAFLRCGRILVEYTPALGAHDATASENQERKRMSTLTLNFGFHCERFHGYINL